MSQYSKDWVGFSPEELVKNTNNILVTDGEGKFGLFELWQEGYVGHYLMKPSKSNLTFCKKGIEFFFELAEVDIVRGYTPTDNAGALRLNKILGFETEGLIDTVAGPHYKVFLTKERFLGNE